MRIHAKNAFGCIKLAQLRMGVQEHAYILACTTAFALLFLLALISSHPHPIQHLSLYMKTYFQCIPTTTARVTLALKIYFLNRVYEAQQQTLKVFDQY